jgi:hypothetical protein
VNTKSEKTITGIISIAFVIWGAAFIYESSFIAIDGNRYFCLFDDAMISMRYAWNFAHGEGLVWNPGEYIQGYTNLLMTLVMSFATLVFDKSTAALFIQVLGVFFTLAIAYATMQIANYFVQDKNCQRQAFIRVIAFVCTLSYYPLAYWSLMGMETGLLTLLCLLGVLAALNYTKNKNIKQLMLAAVYFGLAFLTRNDSIIFAALTWIYIVQNMSRSNANRKIIPQLCIATSLYTLFIIGQTIFQYLYYGELLPNTYTLKLTGMPLVERISNGLEFVKPFLIGIGFILVVSSLHFVANLQKQTLLLLSIAYAAIAYQIYVGGDPWNYWRMISPAMPFLFILFVCAIAAFVDTLFNTSVVKDYFISNHKLQRGPATEVSIVLLIMVGLFSANFEFLPETFLFVKPLTVTSNQRNVNTAIAINQLTTSDASVGVFWAGAIPYFTGRKAFDFLGKCDRYIAHLPPDLSGKIGGNGMNSVPGHNKYDLTYSIKTLEPTYVQNFQWGSQNLSEWATYKYDMVNYMGDHLYLLKGSPAVLWSKINSKLGS